MIDGASFCHDGRSSITYFRFLSVSFFLSSFIDNKITEQNNIIYLAMFSLSTLCGRSETAYISDLLNLTGLLSDTSPGHLYNHCA